MKVPDNLLFSLFQEQDARIRRQLAEKSLEISTGRKYRNISDDPSTTYNILELKKDISQLSQYSKNRLFADTALSYADFNLGKITDSLNLLYAKTIQAKNQVLQSDQLIAIGELFSSSLRALLDRVNDQLGGNYIFGGASLTQKPFDENTLDYVASTEGFKVWLSDNYKVDAFLNGGETFGLNVAISRATFSNPEINFNTSGTLNVSVGTTAININYTTTQTLNDLVQFINSNYSNLLQAKVSQNPDGTYSLMLMPVDISKEISVSDTSGGDFDSGTADFYSPNVLQAVKRVGDKLSSSLYPDDSDLMLLQRAFDRVSYRRSQVGSVLSQVKNLQPVQENLRDNLNKQKSDFEDAELSQSIMDYTRYRIAYEALMRIIADQKDMSIIKYIR
ncbi:flagellar hook-associated protein FlgL [Hydrogenobacter sp. T-2]|uniref:flagellar hook-associated protein FlgL n=1 Tax=Pampinifervens diazotrophicum TaxID=1632018 RepID=UPI002B262ABB|nr:flagellar hook-associated protein FlgL [Hydrogenobacter sp. T-2]WPM31866.1 flagellar hook-associated protein FlgL [Hydrogenobacter sp. T-2]